MKVPRNLKNSLGHLGRLLILTGFILLVPIFIGAYYSEWTFQGNYIYLGYLIPSIFSLLTGYFLTQKFKMNSLSLVQGVFLTGLSWIIISFFCSLPFLMITEMGFIDSMFEAVSGFTTTGMTMILELEIYPRSLLFFRGLIQWVGGLGIVTFFLFIGRKGISEHLLYRGETHKISSSRPLPNINRTIKYLWIIYIGFTAALIILLNVQGLSLYDAVTHAFTTLSTGGFSPYAESIAHFEAAGYQHYKTIEYTFTLFMIIGGTSFLVHHRVLRGKIKALWNNLEMKLWWFILGGGTLLIMWESGLFERAFEPLFRETIFQVSSIASTTGYETQWIGGEAFGALAGQIFLILMVVGGCVGSTGGGFKVKRVGIMMKGIWNWIKRSSRPRRMKTPLQVDGEKVPNKELIRIFTIFAAWMFMIVFGAMITAMFSDLGTLASFSGMFSALGNIGPSYIAVEELVLLDPIIKIVYIFGMLLGRLEILPIFILFNREVWSS